MQIKTMVKHSPTPPTFVETLSVFLLTVVCTTVVGIWGNTHLVGRFLPFFSIVTHVPLFVISWVWYQYRVAPCLAAEQRSLWRWVSGRGQLLVIIAGCIALFNTLSDIFSIWGNSLPLWYQRGRFSILLTFLFQGALVGISEELFIRPALQLPLSWALSGGIRILKKWQLSYSLLLSALCFAFFHLGNLFISQSIGDTIGQVVTTFILGIVFGSYYERSRNYLGTALLHNIYDVCGVIVGIVVGILRT